VSTYGSPKKSTSTRHLGSHRHYPTHKRLGEHGSDGRSGCAIALVAAGGGFIALVSTVAVAVVNVVS
jgi:hypothetical protein